jgi:hypothetical protein
MIRRLLKKLLFAVYITVITIVLLEIGVRIWGYSEHHICDPIYMSFPLSQEIPYIHKPNLSQARARGLAIINTDSIGLRSKTAGTKYGPRQDNEYRIAIVGDSVTFGEGVKKTEDTFPQVLEDTLNQKQGLAAVKVFNFSASAYSVKVMAATLRHRMLDMEPDLVIMAIVPADFNLSRTPSVDAWGYLSDNKLSGFLPRDSRLRLPLRKIHLLYLLRDIIYNQLDSEKRAEDIITSGEVPDSFTYIREFKEFAEQHKLAYIIVLLPSLRSQFGNVISQLHQDDISFVDLTKIRERFSAEQFQASKFDTHPSAIVHQSIGESLAEYIFEGHLMDAARLNLHPDVAE